MKESGLEIESHLKIYEDQTAQLKSAYEKVDPVSWRKHPLSPLTPLFLSHLTTNLIRLSNGDTPRPKILDLGCGAGEKTNMIRGFSLDIVGVDYLKQPLFDAKRLAKKEVLDSTMNLVAGNILNLPFEDGVFDGAHDYLTFLHVMKEDWDKYIKSVHRILKDGAPLLIVTFSGNDPDFYGYPINRLGDREIVFSDKFYKGDKSKVTHLINSYFYFPTQDEIKRSFGSRFEILQMVETPHPLHAISEDHRGRKLWHILLKKS